MYRHFVQRSPFQRVEIKGVSSASMPNPSLLNCVGMSVLGCLLRQAALNQRASFLRVATTEAAIL